MAQTHFAAVKDGIVVGTRSSASRHVDGLGKFGPYTHALLRSERKTFLQSGQVVESTDVISWHGSAPLAAAARRLAHVGLTHTMDYSYRPVEEHYKLTYTAAEIVPVVVVARKAKLGARVEGN
jgi:hypothetical protein